MVIFTNIWSERWNQKGMDHRGAEMTKGSTPPLFSISLISLLSYSQASAPFTSPLSTEGSSRSGMWSAGAHEDYPDDEIDESTANPANLPFPDWVIGIRDGREPQVAIDEMVPTTFEADELVDFAFPDHILRNPEECLKRYILAPTSQQVKYYNDLILDRVHGDQRACFAADSLEEVDELYCSILDYVHFQTPPGLPDHTLKIKTNAVYRFIKDFSVPRHLSKNARVIVTDVGTRIVTIRPLNDPDSEDIPIPRIKFTHQLPSGHTLCRLQFPLAPAFATTFDDCLGPTLDRVAIDLTQPALSRDQLYTALSKIRNRTDGLVRLTPGNTR